MSHLCASIKSAVSTWREKFDELSRDIDTKGGEKLASKGAKTAKFFESYSDAPETCGIWSTTILEGKMEPLALNADKAGLQLSVHAIGDEANHLMLEIYRRMTLKRLCSRILANSGLFARTLGEFGYQTFNRLSWLW